MTAFVDEAWAAALPTMMDYVAIPARSPMFDPQWEQHGHLARAATLLRDWATGQAIEGATVVTDAARGR